MTGAPPGPSVVALVPAKDRVDSVAATVAALRGLGAVDRVVVVDDGSTDDTAGAALGAGAEVLRLPANRGKGGAVRAGVEATPGADVYLLIDADLASTAAAAGALLDPVLADEADLVIGVLPPAAGRGGGGRVKALARWGILRACGREVREPLSGQRAVRRQLLVDLTSAERFGLEVAMTIDVVRAGARVLEVDVPMDHRHTGGSWAGAWHRARQGLDVGAGLWPRLTTARQRLAGLVAVFVVAVLAVLGQGSRSAPASTALAGRPDRVLVVAVNPMGFDDLGTGATPNLDRVFDEGAVAAMSVRTGGDRPSLAEGYLSLGAGSRLRALPSAGEAYPAGERIGDTTAGEAVVAQTGEEGDGAIAVTGVEPTVDLNRDPAVPSPPGALGDALAAAGLAGAVVGNGDRPPAGVVDRPASLALMDGSRFVPHGDVDPGRLLEPAPDAPYGVRSDVEGVVAAVEAAAEVAEVVLVDPGDLGRAEALGADVPAARRARMRREALAHTDAVVGRLLDGADGSTMVVVVSVAPPGSRFRLTPMAVAGPGVPRGEVVSPSTKRAGLVTLTDLAPTILEALGREVPSALPGRALEYRAGRPDLDRLRQHDRGGELRDRTYEPQAVAYIVVQVVVYGAGILLLARSPGNRRGGSVLRFGVLAAAAFPLATFLFRALPGWSDLPVGWGWAALVAIAAGVAAVASPARRTPLRALDRILAATIALVVVDCALGTPLHLNSWLGYSLPSTGRFYGLPNTTFAVLAASAVLLASSHVRFAPRRREAVAAAAALLAFVALVDGAPGLGGDVGGIVTLVPVFGLLLWALAGRRMRPRTLAVAAGATLAAVSLAAVVDHARPPSARTHLGRFVADLLDGGPSELFGTIERRQEANLRILEASPWAWLVPLAAAVILYLLVVGHRWSGVLPRGGALRAGAVATVAGSLLGFVANDSGPIVIALFFAYLGPYVTLLALDRGRGQPELVAAPGRPGG